MPNRHAVAVRRAGRQLLVPFRRLAFRVSGLEEMGANTDLVSYLAAANIQFSALDPSKTLMARLVQMPQLTFARVRMPRSTIEWPRDTMSLDRGIIFIARGGAFSVESESPVWSAHPGLYFIPPGDTHVRFHATEAIEDFIYISASTSVIRGIVLPKRHQPLAPTSVHPAALAPLLGFINALFDASLEGSPQVVPLQAVAAEITRSLVHLITADESHELNTYDFALQVIAREYAKPHMVVATIAAAVNVSERTLHLAFAEHDTTVMTELRVTRVRAAEEIRKRNPGISRRDLAMAAGFGSISSLLRALKEFGEKD